MWRGQGRLGLCSQDMGARPCREVGDGGQTARAGTGRHWTMDSDPGTARPVPSLPQSLPAAAAATMLPAQAALLAALLLAPGSLGWRARGPPRWPSPISAVAPQARFDVEQFAGTWLLAAVASECRFLREQGHRAEATALRAEPRGAAWTASTLLKLDGVCWQVRQLYEHAGAAGRFLLPARGARGPVHVVVGETDYRGFAVLHLQSARQLSVKLYARSLPVTDSALSAFERRVHAANLTEDHVLFFPKYGFCDSADQFHTLDETRG
ncbi:complement component C8 gamma chain [Dasypus novemcinctus]|uniref:complement component C8 gamma chain n=1 Tax=Dasypus novemcinctus TaxID=9361 RepID=UPI00265D7A54|nr:complement component C8 gamma chain isoform X2 [Dasypus novemcinctus]